VAFDPETKRRVSVGMNARNAALFGAHREELLARFAGYDADQQIPELDRLMLLLHEFQALTQSEGGEGIAAAAAAIAAAAANSTTPSPPTPAEPRRAAARPPAHSPIAHPPRCPSVVCCSSPAGAGGGGGGRRGAAVGREGGEGEGGEEAGAGAGTVWMGFVGYPNVGKSSVVNALCRARSLP
jgi:hypothetical protein